MKATATAPSNIAFVKYWGKRNEELRLPANGSISMNLSNLTTTTTVEFDSVLHEDRVVIDGNVNVHASSRVSAHLDRVRKLAGIATYANVVSTNSFPVGTGLSSSASGFAALTLAATLAARLTLSQSELSILARLGSGSACRSIPDGFVEWKAGDTSQDSYAYSLYPPDWWDIADVVAIVSTAPKKVSSTEGQKLACTSPLMKKRLQNIDKKISLCKTYLKHRDFTAFGELVEEEALEMHEVMRTSTPPLLYITRQAELVMECVRNMRKEGVEAYFTLNTGQDVHILVEGKNTQTLTEHVSDISCIRKIIVNHPAMGVRIVHDT